MIGRTISHYRALAKLGEGGMGVVYKAEDLKLHRVVALKFLRAELLGDQEHKARFLREAQAAAALTHPHICTVHELDEAEGQTFIAMEFVDGDSVRDKIARRPLPLGEALDIAIQTAQGLNAAHEKGVVHRDIKSANLLVTPSGQVKIMDFGLAQLAERTRLTQTTTMLGTPAYMSPEQAERTPTDSRTDVWSLGVVLYEMATGRLPFEGEREAAVLYAITHEEHEPITAQRVDAPVELDHLLSKAMAKSADERYQHVDEMLVDLRALRKRLDLRERRIPGGEERAAIGVHQRGISGAPGEVSNPKRKLLALQAALGVLGLALLALSLIHFREAPPEDADNAVRKFAFVPEGLDIAEGRGVIAPNGRHIAYIAERRLWIQDLDQTAPRQVEETAGAARPFWSPRSDFVGFVIGPELSKVAVAGGPVIPLCRMPGSSFYFSGTWSPDGEAIVFTSDAPTRLFEVPARGGTPKLLIEPDEAEHSSFLANPFFLPPEAGSRILAFSLGNAFNGALVIQNLDTGERHRPAIIGASFSYSATGHILYQTSNIRSGVVSAVPFSLRTLTETGEAFPVAQNAGWPSVARAGTLVYREEPGPRAEQLVWRGRDGQRLAEIDQPHQDLQHPTLSPDGRRVVFIAGDSDSHDVWIFDLAQGTRVRVTQGIGDNRFPAWSPTKTEVAFTSYRAGNQNIFLRQADGTGQERMLTQNPGIEVLSDWSSERKILLYYRFAPNTQRDLWFLQNSEEGELESRPLIETPFNEREATLSPDGRWLAYVSDKTGQDQVYVRPYPDGQEAPVSRKGGAQPRWSRTGRELHYVEHDTLFAVNTEGETSFSVGSATPLFADSGLVQPFPGTRMYDVGVDGRRFLVVTPVEDTRGSPPVIRVVQNWYEEFRGRGQN